ncbi:MAG: hypothetical protein RIS92_402 [Verrucomicrobiota bacterium]
MTGGAHEHVGFGFGQSLGCGVHAGLPFECFSEGDGPKRFVEQRGVNRGHRGVKMIERDAELVLGIQQHSPSSAEVGRGF